MPALGDLFAPAYNPTDPQSVQAVQAWTNRNQGISPAEVEQTRMASGVNTGNAAGMVDPNALRSLAQGGPYDMNARRDAIAAQVQANEAAKAKTPTNPMAAYWAAYATKMGVPAAGFGAMPTPTGGDGGGSYGGYGPGIFQNDPFGGLTGAGG
jgi:hypothetical protein